MSEEKPFAPTERKLKEARRQGQVIKSTVITQLSCIVGMLLGAFAGCRIFLFRNEILLEYWGQLGSLEIGAAVELLMWPFFSTVVFALVSGVICVVIVEACQVGVKFEFAATQLKLSRLNPVSGSKRIVVGLKRLWFVALKFVVLLGVVLWFLFDFHLTLPGLLYLELAHLWLFLERRLFGFFALFFAILALAGVGDYLLKKKEFLKEQSMNHEEYRREQKDNEGDPHLKAHQRSMQEEILSEELTERVRSSKVIIVGSKTP